MVSSVSIQWITLVFISVSVSVHWCQWFVFKASMVVFTGVNISVNDVSISVHWCQF